MATSGPLSLRKLMTRGTALGRLVRRAAEVSSLTDRVRGSLPAKLRPHLVSVVVESPGRAVIIADSAAWAARLRYFETAIETVLEPEAAKIEEIRIRVAPRGRRGQPE